MKTTEKLAEAARGLANYLHSSDYGDMPRAAELVDAAREALAQFDAERAGLADGEQVLPPLPAIQVTNQHEQSLIHELREQNMRLREGLTHWRLRAQQFERAVQSSQPLPVRDERGAFIEEFGRQPESVPMIYLGWQARAALPQPAPEAQQGADGGYCPGCTPANCGRGLCGRAADGAGAGSVVRRGIYVASRASSPARPAMWRSLRDSGWPIVSSWIDEAGDGETTDFASLWARIEREISGSAGVIVYAEADDFPLKGAYIEAGIALGAGLPVAVVLPGIELAPRSDRPIGSWVRHPKVRICLALDEARAWISTSRAAPPPQAAEPAPAGEAVAETLTNAYRGHVAQLIAHAPMPAGTKLYTTPPPAAEAREALSDEALEDAAAFVRVAFGEGAAHFNDGVDALRDELTRRLGITAGKESGTAKTEGGADHG